MLDGCFPAPGGRLGVNGAHGEFVGRLGENSGFLSQPLKLFLPSPPRAVGAAGPGLWQCLFASRTPWGCNGSVTFPVNGVWHRRRSGGVRLLIGCHEFCLNWGPAFCASKSPIPVPGWGMKSAERNHKIGISWVGRETQGSSNLQGASDHWAAAPDLYLQHVQVTEAGLLTWVLRCAGRIFSLRKDTFSFISSEVFDFED